MHCTRIAVMVLVAGLFGQHGLSGQTIDDLAGETVRVSVRGVDADIRGTLLEVLGDTLILSETNSLRRVDIPVSRIVGIQQRVMARKHWTGLWQGALLGGAGGLIYGAAQDNCIDLGEALCAGYLGIIGAFGGGLLGLAIGAAIKSEEWIDVPVEVGAGGTPGGGARLMVTVPIGT